MKIKFKKLDPKKKKIYRKWIFILLTLFIASTINNILNFSSQNELLLMCML